jgi:hypothetical protein
MATVKHALRAAFATNGMAISTTRRIALDVPSHHGRARGGALINPRGNAYEKIKIISEEAAGAAPDVQKSWDG